jgi:hypothetical protein
VSTDCQPLEKFFEDCNTLKEFGANPISEFIASLHHFQKFGSSEGYC